MVQLVSVPAPVEDLPTRPKVVSVIGWIWLVLSILLVIKGLVNLISVSVARALAPGLFRMAQSDVARVPAARWALEHGVAIFATQAVFWIFVGIAAVSFLRLRPWAHRAIEAVCWLGLLYALGFLVFWYVLWRASAADPTVTPERALGSLIGGIGLTLLLATGLIVMLRFLKRRQVLEAFSAA